MVKKKEKLKGTKLTPLKFSPTSYAFFASAITFFAFAITVYVSNGGLFEIKSVEHDVIIITLSLLFCGLFCLIVGYLYRKTAEAHLETSDLIIKRNSNPDDRGVLIGCSQFLGLPISILVVLSIIGESGNNFENWAILVFIGLVWLLIVALPMVIFIRSQKGFNKTLNKIFDNWTVQAEEISKINAAKAAKTKADNKQKAETAEVEYRLKKDEALFIFNKYLESTQTKEEKLKEQIHKLQKNIEKEKAKFKSLKENYPFIEKIITNR